MNDINIAEFIKKEKTSEFLLGCSLPLGYVSSLPIVGVVAGKLCLKIPYLKYKVTGEIDKTLVFPVKYVLSYSLPDLKPIAFEDLSFNPAFRKVDFNKPIGFFRHEAIKSLSKAEYQKSRNELLSMYDNVIKAIITKTPYSGTSMFKKLLGTILEPSVKPIYKVLDKKFYDNFLS